MAVFKKDVLLCLALLLSSAEATNFSDPIVCYVLDAVLLLYCIIFTALYFKLKFEKAKAFVKLPDKSALTAEAGQDEGHYQALVGQSNQEYEEIKRKSKPRKHKSKSKEPKSKSGAAEAIEMN
ncbi:CD247 antigen like [Neoarius graeffei]|uniref:CD247 antigen like n=1 Tax=Neoarius graeffei TaxID=443677 RepID=UPI00298C484E|nr:CD247 antigen like [Neoarius graeffei]